MDSNLQFALVLLCCKLCLVAVNPVNPAPTFISKDVVGYNDSFTMWCNLSSFSGVQLPLHKYVHFIGMVRQLPNQKETMVATYQPLILNIPEGRDWVFNYTGGPGEFTKDSISLTWTVNDAKCTDAGVYKCMVMIAETGNMLYSTPFQLKKNESVKNVTAMDRIYNWEYHGGDYNTSFVKEHVTYSLECTFRGPMSLSVGWRYGNIETTDDRLKTTHYPAMLTTDVDGCPVYFYHSKKVVPGSDTETHYCVALSGDRVVGVASLGFIHMYGSVNAGAMRMYSQIYFCVPLCLWLHSRLMLPES